MGNKKQKQRKASMSFWTSLSLSANNLRTKKGRTIMTAFAGSIGIIGIALILSMSSGVNEYIESIQEETLSEYPLQITNTALDISSLLTSMTSGSGSGGRTYEAEEDAEITVTQILTTMFSEVEANDLGSLKEYIESGESDIYDYAKAIEYIYDAEPIIYLENEDSYRQVNPDSSTSSSSILSSLSSSSSFYMMPENESLYEDQYEVMAGHWPENYNECVLVLTSEGSISDYTLYMLGLRDYSELEAMIEQYQNGESVSSIDDIGTYTYDDVLGITFKVVCGADLYSYDSEYGVWVDKSDNEDYVNEVLADSEELTIVGVVQPAENSISASLTSGINYTPDLIYHLSELASESDVVQAQLDDPDTNIFTGEEFGDDATTDLDLSSLISIDEDAISEAFDMSDAFSDIELDLSDLEIDTSSLSIDTSELEIDMSALDLSDLDLDLSGVDLSGIEFDMGDMDMSTLISGVTIDTSSMTTLMTDLISGYQTWMDENGATYFSAYLNSDTGKAAISSILSNSEYVTVMVDSDGLTTTINEVMNPSDGSTGSTDATTIATAVLTYIEKNATVTITDAGSQALSAALTNIYISAAKTSFSAYMVSEDGGATIIASGVANMLNTSGLEEAMSTAISSYMTQVQATMMEQLSAQLSEQLSTQISAAMESAMESMMTDLMTQISEQLTESIETMMTDVMEDAMTEITDQLTEAMTDAFSFDADSLADAFTFNMDSTDLTDLLTSMSGLSSGDSYESNLSTLGYIDFDSPSEIDIYPYDFESKDVIVDILDNYNDEMLESGQTEKQITYTDLVGTMMTSVTTIINTVTYVLIAFVAVSLIVSCIMISIITQISTMERTKEIGILRAMGASKGNVSQVFIAETFIIGSLSGLLGVGLTELLIVPINALIHSLTGNYDVNAVLPLDNAAILVVISIVITVLSGLMPALKAAKQDPVTALRTE